jgi:4-hydroxy 2-oxovalerate aldolase
MNNIKLHKINLLDRTLNNGLYMFEPEVMDELFRQLQNADVDWIDRDGDISPIGAKRVTRLEDVREGVIFEPEGLQDIRTIDFVALIEKVAELHPFAVTLSGFSSMEDVTSMNCLVSVADNELPKDIAIGLKPSDNGGLAMSLAIDFVELAFCERQFFLECSLAGFGKGGLLHTESLIQIVNHVCHGERYRYNDIPETIVKHICPLYGRYHWGYGINNLQSLGYIKDVYEGTVVEE